MTPPSADVPVERLVAHHEFVRALARTLVHDRHGADDLEQEVWTTAIARPPHHAEGLRGWFRRLVRSRAVDAGRGAQRRAAAQVTLAASARRETPRPDELASRLEAGRRVAAAVAGLEEPYRGTILLRYFEDLEPAEIAARTGMPVETVRTRLRRAVERLREELDRGRGGHEAWMAALLPLAASAPVAEGVSGGIAGATASHTGSAGALAGGAAMAGKATMTAAAIAGAAGAVVGSLVTNQLSQEGSASEAGAAAVAAEVEGLRRRLDESEAALVRAASGAARASDGRLVAQERRIADLEAALAAVRARGEATPVPAGAASRAARNDAPPARETRKLPDSGAAAPTRDEAEQKLAETLAALRRKVADANESEPARLEALTGLRAIPGGIDASVVLAARDLYRATAQPATRDSILRDLHRLADSVCPGEVKGLFVAGLRDPDESVRLRAAEDSDNFVDDPDVRRELETVKSGDVSDRVRRRAARTLDAEGEAKGR